MYDDVLGPWFQALNGCVWLDGWRRRSRDGLRLRRAAGQTDKQCGESKFKHRHRVLSFGTHVLESFLKQPTFGDADLSLIRELRDFEL